MSTEITFTATTAIGGNVVITTPAKRYVQNGLIAQWDGIENVGYGKHNSSSAKWKNLAGSSTYDFTLNVGTSFNDSALVLDSSHTANASCDTLMSRNDIKTMEVAFRVTSSPNITSNNNRIRLFVFGDRIVQSNYNMTRRCVEWDVNSGKRGWMFSTGNA